MTRRARETLVAVLMAFTMPCVALHAEAAAGIEDAAARADTIVQMLRFVEWAEQTSGRALTLAVVGNGPLAEALRVAAASIRPAGRPLVVVQAANASAAFDSRADVVVVGAMPEAEARTFGAQLAARGVLTVGDGDVPGAPHLALNLFAEGSRYRLQANPVIAARAGASLSSRLLRLAQIVGN